MRGITKQFPGVLALDDVSLDLREGEVHCLLGENGAGKSTLMKWITGALQLDAGTVVLNGREVRFSNPAEAQRAGIRTVYHEIDLLPNLSVAENIMLGREPRRWGGIDWRA
ncbi:MAG TPA: ATP-binding cassette domain-containing protein, partial [Candidatus Hydrogenedentes bacterium]|nr:ATP-binding cassette domain-containing protein [Candidatus Hydrogenedentota bacterium]